MRFMQWNEQMGITEAQYQQQVQQSLNKWLGIRVPRPVAGPRPGRPPIPMWPAGGPRPGPRPDGPRPGRPPMYPTAGPRPGPRPGGPRPGRPSLQNWLGITRRQQDEYANALAQKKHSKGKHVRRKRGNTEPKKPLSPPKPRHNLLSLAQTLNL